MFQIFRIKAAQNTQKTQNYEVLFNIRTYSFTNFRSKYSDTCFRGPQITQKSTSCVAESTTNEIYEAAKQTYDNPDSSSKETVENELYGLSRK